MNGFLFLSRRRLILPVAYIAFALVAALGLSTLHPASAQVASSLVKQISSDPYTNSTSQHQTQVQR